MRALILALSFAAAVHAQPAADPDAVVKGVFPKNRELPTLHLRDIAGQLNLRAGSQVADVGCGEGEIALVWSRAVGPSGHVWAEDISKNAIGHTRKLMKQQHARNVTLLQGAVDDPLLPAGQLDGITLFFVYHELVKYPEMLAHFRQALKPDGRLVILDPLPHKTATRPREVQVRNHVMMPDLAEAELRQAGFEVLHRDDHFADDPDSEGTRWLIVARPVNK